MAKHGCLNNCIHNKPVRLQEMQESYSFRCEAMRIYMKDSDIRKNCRFFQLPYTVIKTDIEDFLNND